MYGKNTMTKVIAGGASTSAGIAVLPATSGNTIGTVLAFTAIAIGVAALMSQVAVRVVRRYYQAK